MSLLRHRLLILAAMNNGLPNMPIRLRPAKGLYSVTGSMDIFRWTEDLFVTCSYTTEMVFQ